MSDAKRIEQMRQRWAELVPIVLGPALPYLAKASYQVAELVEELLLKEYQLSRIAGQVRAVAERRAAQIRMAAALSEYHGLEPDPVGEARLRYWDEFYSREGW